jgi:hypothetical protein
MWSFEKKMILKGINTDLGNSMLRDLKTDGWKVTSEYSDQMFDKGIDFDAYTLKRGGAKVELEWDNWKEWTITGPTAFLVGLAERYNLTNRAKTEQNIG